MATHSPLLMAVPGARIYAFDDGEISETPFLELESVRLVRDFLQAPGRFMNHIWEK